MPKVIVKSCYIKSSAHFINYLEYAGEKLEAQTLVFNDGTEFMADPDELLDVSKIENLRYVQIELKDGTTRRFSSEKYQHYLIEETEKFLEIETVPVSGLSEEDEKSLRNIPPEQYLNYIAFRPGAEKNPNCSHGLFGINGAVNMDTVKESVLENEKSYKWSHIISLTREDAEAAGFDNRKAWENLIKSYAYDIGRLYNIPPEHLEIMAAYHDKSYHPHCHLYFYSNQNTTAEGCVGFNQGDLAKKSEKLRSLFTTKIFQEQTAHLSKEKYQLRENISNELKKIVQEIGKADYKPDKEIVNKFIELSNSLSDYSGRAYYAYLSSEQKKKVVEFMRTAVSSDSNLNQIYKKMIENQLSFISMYNDDKTKIENRLNDYISRFFEPKSKNDMKKLHNIIIEQAMIYNQKFLSAQESNGVVRKDEFSSFSNDDTSEESFVDDNEQVLDEDSSNVFDESSNDSKSKTDNQQNSKEKQQSENQKNQINKTHIDYQKSSYAASLLLSRLAYAMASLIIQNTQNREDERRRKNNNHKAKFASKNHQITKAHFEPQTPIQY